MRPKLLLLILLAVSLAFPSLIAQKIITNEGLAFSPAMITVEAGETIVFDIDASHNVVEVSQAAFENNLDEPLEDGFSLDFGGGELLLEEEGIYYYICQPHVGAGMKGTIRVVPEGSIYLAEVSGQQVTIPVLSQGSGQIEAVLDGNTLHISGSFSGLSSPYTVSHFHIGYAGTNGGVAFGLTPVLDEDGLGGVFDEEVELTENVMAQLMDRQLYVNIHSQNYPGGELRGQVVPEADEIYYTKLLGSMEAPPVMTDAIGSLVLEVHDDELVVSGSYRGLSSALNTDILGGAHLHVAMAGSNGGVEIELNPDTDADMLGGVFEPTDNTFSISSDIVDAMDARMVYANIHSLNFPAGEIRGQVHPYATSVWRAFLSGPQEVPPVASSGNGQVMIELAEDEITLSGTFNGLVSDFDANVGGGAHIHTALAGSNGGVAIPISRAEDADLRQGAFMPDDNAFTLDDAALTLMFERGLYVNIHTDSFPGGEIRGQILPQAQFYVHGLLAGVQQPGGVATDGLGVLVGEVLDTSLTLSGSLADLNSDFNTAIAGGAHLHYGMAGQSGSIAIGLGSTDPGDLLARDFAVADNMYELSAGLYDSLKMRMLYANIHTVEHPGGEIRGQMLPEAQNYFISPLSGASESPAVSSTGTGMVVSEWNGSQLVVSGSFTNLTSPVNTEILGGAHLHAALPGMNGGVRQPLNIVFTVDDKAGEFLAADNTFQLEETLGDSLLARLIYTNIHTDAYGGGEIRGQLRAPAARYFTTFAQSVNAVPPVATTGIGALNLELSGSRLVAYGAFRNLVGSFDGTPAGGSHLHYGTAGTTGGIAVGLNATPGMDNDTSGTYVAAQNVFSLDATQLDSLIGRNLYYNLHTTEVPSGEVRGMILPESNFYPDSSMITAPDSDAALTIEGDAATPFVAEWEPVMDPDMDSVVYVWQLAAGPAFEEPLVSVNVGGEPRFETDFGTVAALLQSAGVEPGGMAKVYHRVLASDGSLLSPSRPDSVNLTLGIVTSLDEVLARKFQLELYPVPANDWVQVNVLAEERAEGLIQLFDYQGRLLGRYPMELFVGENQQRLDLSQAQAGHYFLQLLVNGQPVPARKLLLRGN